MADQDGGERKRRVHMGARNMAESIDHDGNHQAGDKPGTDHAEPAPRQAIDHHRAGGEEHQAEGADELAAIFTPVVARHSERMSLRDAMGISVCFSLEGFRNAGS